MFVASFENQIDDFIADRIARERFDTNYKYYYGQNAINLSQKQNSIPTTQQPMPLNPPRWRCIIPSAGYGGEENIFDKAFFARENLGHCGEERKLDFGIICELMLNNCTPILFSAFRLATLNPNAPIDCSDDEKNYPLDDDAHCDWCGKGLDDPHHNAITIISQFKGSVYDAIKQLAGYTIEFVNQRFVETWEYSNRDKIYKIRKRRLYDLMIVAGPKYKEGTKNLHSISFIIEGQEIAKFSLRTGDIVFTPKVKNKENYIFTGWEHCPCHMPDADLFIHGYYKRKVCLVTFILDNAIFSQEQVEVGSQIPNCIVPQKIGYTFSGWKDNPITMPNNDLFLKGHYIPISYNITYIINGKKYAEQSVQFGTLIRPIPVPEDLIDFHWTELPNIMEAKDILVELVKN